MILHFVIDGKLTDQFIDNFMLVSDKNFFLVFGPNSSANFKRITRKGNFIDTYDENRDDINNIIARIGAKAIILHSLSYDFARAVLKIQKEITICWSVWGFDIYGLPRIEPKIYAPVTSRFLIQSNPSKILKRIFLNNEFLRRIYFKIIKGKEDLIGTVFKAQKKIKYFLTYIEEDYQVFSKYYPNNLRFIYGTFSSIDQYLAGNKDLSILPDAENILLGNSFSPSSNYLDAMLFLSRKNNPLKKVYAVLSYGLNEEYKCKVLKAGNKLLGDHFSPLLEFIDRRNYIQLLQTCSTGIFYHYRQQAMGNIIAMLYMGSRVYLSSKNPAFGFFIRNRIFVNCLEEEFELYGSTRLNIDIVKQNRQQLDKIFSKEKVLNDLINVFKTITNS